MKDLLNNKFCATMLVLFISGSAATASARPDVEREKMPEPRFEHVTEKLELSQDQILQAEQLRQQADGEHAALREQVRKANKAIKEQSKPEHFDTVAIESLVIELNELQAKSVSARAQHQHEFQQILNDEQRLKMAELKDAHDNRIAASE